MSKQAAIAEVVMNQAQVIINISKTLPNTSKRRNIFKKTYDRRPNNKSKRALAFVQMAITSAMSAAQIGIIAGQRTPKFKSGTI